MKPADVATFLGIGRSTVTAWTNHEYREYFTPSAQGGQGRPRNFTDLDVRIMYALKLFKDDNTPPDTIHETLRRWRADDWQGLPDMPEAPKNFANVPVVPAAAADAALSTERRALLREIALLQGRVEQLESKLDDKDDEVKDLLREISELQKKIGSLETEIDLWRAGRIKPSTTE